MAKRKELSNHRAAVYARQRALEIKAKGGMIVVAPEPQKTPITTLISQHDYRSMKRLKPVIDAYPAKQSAWIDSVKETRQTVTTPPRAQALHIELFKTQYESMRSKPKSVYA